MARRAHQARRPEPLSRSRVCRVARGPRAISWGRVGARCDRCQRERAHLASDQGLERTAASGGSDEPAHIRGISAGGARDWPSRTHRHARSDAGASSLVLQSGQSERRNTRRRDCRGGDEHVSCPRGSRGIVAADLAYWPFRRLLGARSSMQLDTPWSNEVVQLWSPNKLHGLTGVRAAYLILPATSPAVEPDPAGKPRTQLAARGGWRRAPGRSHAARGHAVSGRHGAYVTRMEDAPGSAPGGGGLEAAGEQDAFRTVATAGSARIAASLACGVAPVRNQSARCTVVRASRMGPPGYARAAACRGAHRHHGSLPSGSGRRETHRPRTTPRTPSEDEVVEDADGDPAAAEDFGRAIHFVEHIDDDRQAQRAEISDAAANRRCAAGKNND